MFSERGGGWINFLKLGEPGPGAGGRGLGLGAGKGVGSEWKGLRDWSLGLGSDQVIQFIWVSSSKTNLSPSTCHRASGETGAERHERCLEWVHSSASMKNK